MLNLLTSQQMHKADEFTIAKQKISSADLMERAAKAFVKEFLKDVKTTAKVAILCGNGNNGGDGLAIARLLYKEGFVNLQVYLVKFTQKQSADHTHNLKRLQKTAVNIKVLNKAEDAEALKTEVLIDAVLGSGLNKPLTGEYLRLARIINHKKLIVYAVDVPTGFPAEGPISPNLVAITATKVICFQQPKLNFFFPESAPYLQKFKVADIDLDNDFIIAAQTNWKLTELTDIQHFLKPRQNFSHKGTYGHVLLVAGDENTMGAALLAAKASLHAGAGLTTACIPQSGLTALNTSLPEVMYLPQTAISIKKNADKYTSIAVGPGIGTTVGAQTLLRTLLSLKRPLLVDADALNLLAENKKLLKKLPKQSILTPHVKEFDRLFGEHNNWWERLETARKQAKNANWIIVLKNQYTLIVMPSGDGYINPTGNPAMASGGMGDVLTGIMAAYLGQGYSSGEAAIIACYLHGRSGDKLAKKMANVTAGKVAEQVPVVLKEMLVG